MTHPTCQAHSFVNTSGGVLVFPNQLQVIGTFQATRGQAPASIPALNEWGMILLGVLFLGATMWRFRNPGKSFKLSLSI
jgi:hypothetical protein